ncbi:MAG TPA: hypothetical protein VK665_16310 [Candidatus Elarobacter sp.]|nr:hypothetical protein [Candidatus Elarobacter sp.]
MPSQRQIEENDARFRRSNRGGDDLATKLVFAVIVLAIAGWLAFAWLHKEHSATRLPPDIQRKL